jgi:hypothetical protein
MPTNLKIHVISQFQQLATRPEGIGARNFVLERLQENERIELDFSGAVMTPSFAEEFIGKLASHLGLVEFSRRVTLTNVSEQAASLFQLVITRQTKNGVPAA